MGILKKFGDQFKKPEGFFGSIAGKLMATVSAEKNKWTISLLNVKKDDNVLEIGFGPGIGIEVASKVIQDGKIIGIDYSEKMLQQAQKRNKDSIQKGQVELILADAQNLPSFNLLFDKVFSINTIIFWGNPVETLKGIRKFMKENGVITITVQPFMKGATEESSKRLGIEISNQLKDAGYSNIKMELKKMKPIATVCVLGVNS
ncbi:class I SAM-dependent methyltransferase [Bacillus timonensis]|uniref:Class I SAM-dependent methyltransferase n=1 Tax=Bacillus timonensis TaxID=1033734 RepID=A0A4S3PS37_9BACI|nr:class I SAM-dependent methyltransferase [Bacillus timonensis]THE11622.1 class I SAM-dependent methyltransferase [Bacillus timonensis]